MRSYGGVLFPSLIRSHCFRDQQAKKNNSSHHGIGEHEGMKVGKIINEIEVGEYDVLQGEQPKCEAKEN